MHKILISLILSIFTLLSVQAQTAYGFLTGTGNTALEVGIYSVDVKDGQSLSPIYAAMFGLWGGAGDATDYYCLLSTDYDGYSMAGLAAYNLKSGSWNFRSTQINYGCADMTYDITSQTMYGLLCKQGGSKVPTELGTIDLDNGQYSRIAVLDDKIVALAADADGQLYGLSSASDLYKMSKQNGALTLVGHLDIATLTDQVQSMEFDRDNGRLFWSGIDGNYDAFIAQIDPDEARILSRTGVEDNTLLGGLYIPYTTQGGGGSEPQIPAGLTSLSAQNVGTAARLTWTDENPAGTRYRITRQPDGQTFEGIAEKTFTDEPDAPACYYTYSVCAYNELGSSNALTTMPVLAGEALKVPYAMDFTNTFAVAQWLTVDANADGVVWKSNAGNFQYFASFFKQADDWLMSVPFQMKKGQSYKLTYTVDCPSILGSAENLSVTLGKTPDPASHQRTLEELKGFTTAGATVRTVEFTADETAGMHIGFHTTSLPDQFQILISDIQLTSYASADLSVATPAGDFLAIAGRSYDCSVRVKNEGETAMSNFSLRLLDDAGNACCEAEFSESLAAGSSHDFELSFVPQAEGVLTLHAEIAAEGDQNADNDCSAPFMLEVRPATEQIVRIGTQTASPFLIPVAFEGYYYSFSQAIYRPEELASGAAWLKEIGYSYYSKAASPIENVQLRLALANTPQQSPKEGWLEEDGLTTVYDAKTTFGVGGHVLRLPFNEPFLYDGTNLCVMLSKLRDATFQEVHFDATDYPGEVRTAFGYNDNGAVVLNEINGSSMLNDIYLIVEPCDADGIRHLEAQGTLRLLPNGRNCYRLAGERVCSVRVFAADGRCVVAQASPEATLDLQAFAPGVYLLQAQTAGGVLTAKVQVR